MYKNFYKMTKVRYLSTFEFFDEKAKRFAKVCWKRRDPNREQKWLGELYGPDLKGGIIAPVAIRWIDNHLRFGLFAEKDFKRGDYIGSYAGQLIRRDLFKRRANDYCFRYPVEAPTLFPLMIDAKDQGNETRFINHSFDPNCEAMGIPYQGLVYLLIRARRAIPSGAQLTLDYGPDYWKRRVRKKLLKKSPLG